MTEDTQKRIGIALFVFGAAALAAWFGIMQSRNAEPPTPPAETEPSSEVSDPEPAAATSSWNTFAATSSTGVSFSLLHPSSTTVREVQEDIYEIKYIGPNAEPNTEITDGYLATLQLIENGNPQGYAEEQNDGEAVGIDRFLDRPAYQYENESVLSGELIVHQVFRVTERSNTLADLSWQTYGEHSSDYEEELQRIWRTLRFTDPATEGEQTLIEVSRPEAGETVGNPIELTGEARGNWFFEASAPVVVTDWDGRIIGESFITAEGEWMTEEFVPFSGTVEYELPADSYSATGTVIFQKANPSGLPEHDAAREVRVILERS